MKNISQEAKGFLEKHGVQRNLLRCPTKENSSIACSTEIILTKKEVQILLDKNI